LIASQQSEKKLSGYSSRGFIMALSDVGIVRGSDRDNVPLMVAKKR
jgi:hypothetical protein